jgi:hypothetical protein
MSTASTINIRGARLYEVTSTVDTATSTAITAVMVETLPQESAEVRDGTLLTSAAAVRLPGRLKDYGSFVHTVYVTPGSFASVLGASKTLRLDIPADKDGTATTHEIIRIWMAGAYTGDEALPGSDTEEVSRRRTFTLSGAAVYGTATASIL